jgi:PEP-CTERM motif
MKKWIATLALAAASMAAQAGVGFVNGSWVSDNGTVADPYQLGSLTRGSGVTLSVGLAGRVGQEFEEHASFTVAQDLDLYGSASTLTLTIFGVNVVAIEDFVVELWDGTHPDGDNFFAEFDGTNTTVSLGSLVAGTYHLDIFGTLGANLGAYAVTLQAAPVPEPSTYALLLAGLGVVGFVARRRREMV